MKVLCKLPVACLFFVLFAGSATAQCENWINSSQKEEAENAHVLYRGLVKGKQPADLAKLDEENFSILFENWKIAYSLAPAADGQRPSHYADGRKIYKAMMLKEQDAAKKNEYAEIILRLYEEQMQCYKNESYLLGRKAFDMLYFPSYSFGQKTLDAFKLALEKGDKQTEYILLEPLGQLLVYLFKNNKVSQQEAQKLYVKMEEIADHNIENNKRFSEYYKSAKARMASHFFEIEDAVFDCVYFKKKLLPQYQENPEDLEIIKYVYNKLKNQGCDPEDAELIDLKGKYESLAAEINEGLEVERRKNNPGYDAVQLQKKGKYKEAVARYKEAVILEENNDAKAQYYYSIAFIQTWQLGQYTSARDNARKAAKFKPGWGKPFILIGDMYTKTSRKCGDDWDTRMAVLAALDKYAHAKSIDSEVAADARDRIGKYSGSKPEKQDGFMRGIKAGQSVKVGCWIGETVKVRYK